MFTQVGVKTITAGGAPSTGPIQAVGGNRGAALYSADGLDYHIGQLSLLNVDDAVLATVPQLNDEGYRDSGVFTTVLGVNLRDQIRPNDTVPLQFKYEAADCRIFYTLDNVYNMSRLWRDAVSASFDDNSLCVEGSTGYKNSSNPAPEPVLPAPSTLNFDVSEPDEFLIGDGLDLSGGLQAAGKGANSGRITLCTNGCDTGSECRDVVLRSCTPGGLPATVERCVPIRQGQDNCPSGTTWEKRTPHVLKTAANPLKKGAFQKTTTVWTGPCTPNTQSALCG